MKNISCTSCDSTEIIRRGYRKKKMETLPLYLCKSCGRTFTKQILQGKTYPLKIIFEAISLYNLGYSLIEVSKRLKSRFGVKIKKSTISSWIKEFKDLCTYSRFRGEGRQLFTPNQIIRAVTLYHIQIYRFCYHQSKLQLLLEYPTHHNLSPLKEYLEDIAINCPHKFFKGDTRSSSVKADFDLNQVQINEKFNNAVRLSKLALQAAPNNRARHDTLQRFMLANDSATVATEVPVYLKPEDVSHFKNKHNFNLPFNLDDPLSGHIDFIQIRNKAVHILDYRPNAKKGRYALSQLTIYALALSRRTGLKLMDFRCAWFDEKDYFEFYPLHLVHKLSPKS